MKTRIDLLGWSVPALLLIFAVPVALGGGAPNHVGPATAVSTVAVLMLLLGRGGRRSADDLGGVDAASPTVEELSRRAHQQHVWRN